MANIINISWDDIWQEAEKVAERLDGTSFKSIHGVLQGGTVPAVLLANYLGVNVTNDPVVGETLIIDDLVDSGKTLQEFKDKGFYVDAFYRKPKSPKDLAPEAKELEGWLSFPWEKDDGSPQDAVRRLLQFIGENPDRDGLIKTPHRVTKALKEMTEGYFEDPSLILGVTFDVPYDQMIVLRDVPFVSMCEHHMLPFEGTASVAYIPKGRVVGLSKLARVVDTFAKRLQVQERLTQEIASAIDTHVEAAGVGVIIKSRHTCMCYRGIKKNGTMVTSVTLGLMRTDLAARTEFLQLTGN